jgi:hypothetical protein
MPRTTRFQRLTHAALVAAATLAAAALTAARPSAAQELHCESGACSVEPAEGWIRGPEGPVFARYERIDGIPVVQGDILVEELGRVGRSAIVAGGIQTWQGGVMPFAIDPALPNPERVLDAVDHINSNTSLTLVPRTQEADYVDFVPSGGCSSFIGRVGGRQPIHLAPGCVVPQTVHEILHAAGFYHEQSRTDRDQFVAVQLQNVEPGKEFNFDTFVAGQGLNHGPYDYASIMHYGTHFFSVNGQPTLVATQTLPPGVVLGGGSGLSPGDISGVTALYGGAPPVPTGETLLLNGVPAGPLAGAQNAELRFRLDVPEGAEDLVFELSGGSGDADLLVAFGRQPSAADFDCRPFVTGNTETCSFGGATPGSWHVLVQGFAPFADSTLVAHYAVQGPLPGGLQPISAAKFKLKQDSASPAKNRMIATSVDVNALPPAAGSTADPLRFGGRLRVVNPATLEQGAIVLPTGGWTRKANGTLRFAGGPCSVSLKPSGRLKVRCAGAVSGFTLNEPAQGSLGLALELGSSGFCAGLGGATTRDFGIGWNPTSPRKGMFTQSAATPPTACSF